MGANASARTSLVDPRLVARLIPFVLAAVTGLSWLGCSEGYPLPIVGNGGGTGDSSFAGPGADLPTSPDLGDTAPDLLDLSAQLPDMTAPRDHIYTPTLMLEEVTTTITVNGIPTAVRALPTVIVNLDPERLKKSDYDDTVPPGVGCAANHYDLAKGDSPSPETDLGTVAFSGYMTAIPVGSMVHVDSEIDCALVAGAWRCSFGRLVNGMPGPQDTNATFFPVMQPLISGAFVVRVRYVGGGPLGTFDSTIVVKTSDSLTLAEDLTRIVYDPAKDTVLHYACDNSPMNCFDLALVQIVASSVMAGQPGYPGSDFGTINCVGLGGQVTVKKEAIAAMFGNSPAIKQVMTRVLRSRGSPFGPVDSKGNPVRLFFARGVMGFAPR